MVSATFLGWITDTGPHCCPTLTFGFKKLLVHSNGHTQVLRVGSHAKLSEGSTQRVSVCKVVNLAPNLPLPLGEAGVG